jgi:hypothetical protein
MGWLGLLLKGKKVAGAIKSVKPTLGSRKTLDYKLKTGYKRGASKAYTDTAAAKAKLDTAKSNLKETFKKSDKVLGELKKTVQKTKHYYAPKDF